MAWLSRSDQSGMVGRIELVTRINRLHHVSGSNGKLDWPEPLFDHSAIMHLYVGDGIPYMRLSSELATKRIRGTALEGGYCTSRLRLINNRENVLNAQFIFLLLIGESIV